MWSIKIKKLSKGEEENGKKEEKKRRREKKEQIWKRKESIDMREAFLDEHIKIVGKK